MSDDKHEDDKGHWLKVIDGLRDWFVSGIFFHVEYPYTDVDELEDKLFHDE